MGGLRLGRTRSIVHHEVGRDLQAVVSTRRERSLGSSRGRTSLVAALVLTAMGATGFSVRAYAYSNKSSPEIECALTREGAIDELRTTLEPKEGATVQVGSSVTLSVRSRSPVSFAIASSPELLASSDIDSGMGIAGPSGIYTFTSDKATAVPGTVYWDASISNVNFPECAGFPSFGYTTTPHKLMVSLPTPTPTPPPTPPSLAPPPVHTPVTVSIVKPGGFAIARPTVVYDIRCTASCSGDTSYQLVLSRHYRETDRVIRLDVESRQVSLAATSGGTEQFVYQYAGRALQSLKRLVRRGDVVEIRIGVEVAGAAGEIAQARSTVRTRVKMGSRRHRRNIRRRGTRKSALTSDLRRTTAGHSMRLRCRLALS
jgi:hypothetical protein